MKKIVAVLFVLLSTVFAVGCGEDPCDTLNTKCGKCADSALKLACDTTILASKVPLADSKQICQSALDSKAYDVCQ